jgi:hypothetical protein
MAALSITQVFGSDCKPLSDKDLRAQVHVAIWRASCVQCALLPAIAHKSCSIAVLKG